MAEKHILLEDLADLGFATGDIILPHTGIKVNIDNSWYRDDGFVLSLREHAERFWSELSGGYDKIPQEITHAIDLHFRNESQGNYVHRAAHIASTQIVGYQDSRQASAHSQADICAKAVQKIPEETSSEEQQAIYLFLHGHEEAELLSLAGQFPLVRDWFKHRGYERLQITSPLYHAINTLKYGPDIAKEMDCNLIAAVLVQSSGLSLEHVLKHADNACRDALLKELN